MGSSPNRTRAAFTVEVVVRTSAENVNSAPSCNVEPGDGL